ncbi:MAG TPA: competence/damage-inducible protein A [Verrucomicrobiae bacterium]|nr:competence/damage-inducible protein A [Verrucomicrobiae bacterium]
MNIELVNTGSELLFGRVLNTHQQWLCRQLTDLGYEVRRQVCVADDGPSIQHAVREALARAELVIVTGGLGPTSDDLTRELIAQLLGRKLVLDTEVLARIESFFLRRKRPVLESMKIQAMTPEGARVLTNLNGTAPGLAMETEGKWVVMLPGPPRELRPMFTASVVPLLREVFPLTEKFVCRTLKTTGMGESMVEERIAPPLRALMVAGLEIGYCARVGEVDVRLVAKGAQAETLAGEGEKIIRSLLGARVFGLDDEALEAVVVRLLTERGQTVALAESCTGGYIAHRLTNVPGASAVLPGSFVTYSDAVKQKLLGVRAATLAAHGAVSAETAREMAEGARNALGADYALAVTGIAGPGGGSDEKPVGTVFIALAHAGETLAQKQFFPFDRETFKFITSQTALDMLRQKILERGAP